MSESDRIEIEAAKSLRSGTATGARTCSGDARTHNTRI
jgi:hypothetical protein